MDHRYQSWPGPFQLLDIIGLVTPYNILANGDEGMQQLAASRAHWLDHGPAAE